MGCSPPGSSVHGISQARILEWVAISFSRGNSRTKDQIRVSRIGRQFFNTESPGKPIYILQFSRSVVSDSLWPHELQHARPPFTNSGSSLKLTSVESVMPSSHLILYSPLLLLSSIFPASGSFLMSQFFALGGQSIGASASVLLMNIQGYATWKA